MALSHNRFRADNIDYVKEWLEVTVLQRITHGLTDDHGSEALPRTCPLQLSGVGKRLYG